MPKYVPGVVSKYGKWTGINVKGIKWLVKQIKVTRINTYPPDEKTAYPHLFRTSTADNPKLTPTVVFRMVGGEVTLSTANPEPCMKVSLHTALQCMVI